MCIILILKKLNFIWSIFPKINFYFFFNKIKLKIYLINFPTIKFNFAYLSKFKIKINKFFLKNLKSFIILNENLPIINYGLVY